jgi:hypothetical protein
MSHFNVLGSEKCILVKGHQQAIKMNSCMSVTSVTQKRSGKYIPSSYPVVKHKTSLTPKLFIEVSISLHIKYRDNKAFKLKKNTCVVDI